MENIIRKFTDFYHVLDADKLVNLEKLYHKDCLFIDPVHKIQGLADLQNYFNKLMTNVEECRFEFHEICQNESDASITWTMTFRNKHLADNQEINVEGMSFIRSEDGEHISYHRDYFDLGKMIYEHVPLLSMIIRYIKNRLK